MTAAGPSTPTPAPEELLERHGTWLLALAHSLVRDAHEAEDAVQRTWLAALRGGPRSRASARGWLAQVLRNELAQGHRARSRRERRERAAARPEASGPDPELERRLELERSLVEGLHALAEPYRSTLALRYLEGRSPKEIARRTGTPVKTVQTRLSRGLAKLRERLDAEHGGRRAAWLTPLATWIDATSPLLPLTLGAGLVNLKILTAAAVILVAAVAWRATLRDDTAGVRGLDAPATIDSRSTELERERDAEPRVPEVRSAIATDPPPAAPAAAPEQVDSAIATRIVEGLLVDPDGDALAGMQLAYEHTEDGERRLTTDAQGRFELTDPLDASYVGVVEPGWCSLYPAWLIGEEREIVVVAARSRAVGGHVVDTSGAPLAVATIELRLPQELRARTGRDLSTTTDMFLAEETDGSGRFDLPPLADVEGLVLEVSKLGFETRRVALERGPQDTLAVELTETAASEGWLRGTVLDEQGAPLAGARVALDGVLQRSGEDGRFEFPLTGVSPDAELVAAAPGRLPERRRATLEGGRPSWPGELVLRLDRPALALRGRVVAADGRPVSGATVFVHDPVRLGDDELGIPRTAENAMAGGNALFLKTISDADGRFTLEPLGERPYDIGVVEHETLSRIVFEDLRAGDEVHELLVHPDLRPGALFGRVVDHRGAPVADVELRLARRIAELRADAGGVYYDSAHGPGVESDEAGRFTFERVPEGELTVTARGEGLFPASIALAADAGPAPLEIRVARRCSFRLEADADLGVDRLELRTAEGEPVTIERQLAGGFANQSSVPVAGGRTELLRAPDSAVVCVLYAGFEEVARFGVTLLADGENVLRP